MKKVLIFGVSGFVGRYLAEEFLSHNYLVIGSDQEKNPSLPKDVSFISADILDEQAVIEIIRNLQPDIVVNLAAISSVGASWGIPQTTITVNVIGALNILEATRKVNPNCKVLFIGSSEEYVISKYPMSEDRELDATNPYGISKVTQEQFAKMYRDYYKMRVYCVRAFNHTGIGQKDSFVLPSWCKQVAEIDKSGKPGTIKVGNLSVQRDFSHVKDIVRAYRMVVESDDCSVVYNIGSGKAYRLEEMLEYIIGLCNQKVSVEIDKDRFRPSDQPVICCDHSLITNQLGWEPRFTVFDALKELFEMFKGNEEK